MTSITQTTKIEKTFDTVQIMFLIKNYIFETYGIEIDVNRDFDIRTEFNLNPDELPNIRFKVFHEEISKQI